MLYYTNNLNYSFSDHSSPTLIIPTNTRPGKEQLTQPCNLHSTAAPSSSYHAHLLPYASPGQPSAATQHRRSNSPTNGPCTSFFPISPAREREKRNKCLCLSCNPLSTNTPCSIAAGALVFSVPAYYIMHSDKPSASEQAKIKEKRRQQGTEGEHRDPRDSPVKTLEQKRAKEGQ